MKRAVRNLIRLIGATIIVFGGLEIGLEYLRHRLRGAEIGLWNCIVGSVLIALGALLIAASSKLAEHFSGDFDE